jgi:hypothetical protein
MRLRFHDTKISLKYFASGSPGKPWRTSAFFGAKKSDKSVRRAIEQKGLE